MKKNGSVTLLAFLILFPKSVQFQPAKCDPRGLPETQRVAYAKNGAEGVERDHDGGWKSSQTSIGPYFVADLEMVPDPARPGQEVRFNLKLRNTGIPVRANIRIEDGEELVARLNDVPVEPGIEEYQFPYNGYFLHKLDLCFTIVIEVEGKRYKAETARELCIKPTGCQSCPD